MEMMCDFSEIYVEQERAEDKALWSTLMREIRGSDRTP